MGVGMLRIPETQPPTPSPVPATVTDSPNMRYRTYPSHTCNNQTGTGMLWGSVWVEGSRSGDGLRTRGLDDAQRPG